MACIVDATAPPGVSLAHEPLTMRVNPMTRTPTPRYAPGRRPRAYHQTHARSVGPTRIPSDPRTKCRTQAHTIGPTCAARNASSSRALGAVSHAIRLSELSTVSANVAIPTIWLRGATPYRGNCMRHSWDSSPGGSHALPPIAPPVAQPLAQPVAAPVAAPVAQPAAWHGEYRRHKRPAQDQGTTHRPAMKQPPPTPTSPH